MHLEGWRDLFNGKRSWLALHGDAAEVLNAMEPHSVDSLVTDPPAGIKFMGKLWDADKGGREHWVWWLRNVMHRALSTMKPGSHGLVWALPRTQHWTATALEDAGFEVRDVIPHLFGTGFPKSRDLDKEAGIGTALKPGHECWILVRKPLDGSLKVNFAEWGTAGLNIDLTRIPLNGEEREKITNVREEGKGNNTYKPGLSGAKTDGTTELGRWPANVILSHGDDCTTAQCGPTCPVRAVDAQSEGASKFFYIAKPARSERDAGLDQMSMLTGGQATNRKEGTAGLKSPRAGAGRGGNVKNFHPTVKSLELMSYLCRLVTPKGGLVLDPFAGSGSTVIAATRQGYRAVGVELDRSYFDLMTMRIEEDAPLFNRLAQTAQDVAV